MDLSATVPAHVYACYVVACVCVYIYTHMNMYTAACLLVFAHDHARVIAAIWLQTQCVSTLRHALATGTQGSGDYILLLL